MLTLGRGRYGISLTEPELQTLGRLIQQRFGEQDPLVGQFFHSVAESGMPSKRGRLVVADGEKNRSGIVRFTNMIDWVFYNDEEPWRSASVVDIAKSQKPDPIRTTLSLEEMFDAPVDRRGRSPETDTSPDRDLLFVDWATCRP
jgi:hypothetical protein